MNRFAFQYTSMCREAGPAQKKADRNVLITIGWYMLRTDFAAACEINAKQLTMGGFNDSYFSYS